MKGAITTSMGETDTVYDPGGHFLISAIGNYEVQEPTQAQLNAIADMTAWALNKFHLPHNRLVGTTTKLILGVLERIFGSI
jgi:hypothetical protein